MTVWKCSTVSHLFMCLLPTVCLPAVWTRTQSSSQLFDDDWKGCIIVHRFAYKYVWPHDTKTQHLVSFKCATSVLNLLQNITNDNTSLQLIPVYCNIYTIMGFIFQYWGYNIIHAKIQWCTREKAVKCRNKMGFFHSGYILSEKQTWSQLCTVLQEWMQLSFWPLIGQHGF